MPQPVELDEDGFPVEICCPSCDGLLRFRGERCRNPACGYCPEAVEEANEDLARVGEELI